MFHSIQSLVEGFLRPRRSYFDDKLDLIRLARLLREKHRGEGYGHSKKGIVHEDVIKLHMREILNSLGPASLPELQEAMDELYLVHPEDTERVAALLVSKKELAQDEKGIISFPREEEAPVRREDPAAA